MPVIAGCLRGLGSTLVNFTQAVDEGTNLSIPNYHVIGLMETCKPIFLDLFQVHSMPKIFTLL